MMMRAASSPMEPLNKNILLAGEVIAEKWKIGEKIGEGTFSQIYSAYSIESRDKVAVKVEAPSSLKPVLEWESLILKSLQDCPYVCRYYYHGKHGDSTVLVMELLGDSMSMLRMSPDSIHGVPLAKAVSVGLEMLDCIEAFHRHGYVHRDIKASNFALSAIPERNPMKQARYYIIDFGLSRQHIDEDRQVLPARQVAEFRGTSMYASLSSHRRQELGPKDDLWSWFYLVMDFLRGELPWAADAQLKNRQTVLSLKEHFTEKNPSLLVEGLPGATQLIEMMDYLQSLKYEDFPDYAKIRKQLEAVGESSLVLDNSDSGDEESSADRKEALAVASVSAVDWSAIKSERERALQWAGKAEEQKDSDGASNLLMTIAKRYKTFFDTEELSFEEREYSKEHSKEYPREYLKEYSKEYSKGYPKEYVKDYPKEYVKGYTKEYAKDYPKEYVENYPKKYPSKDYPPKDYRRRSPSPDRRHSHSREPQYRRSPSQDRHRSHSRDYGREEASWGVDIRYKQDPTPEKHRRSSRWQPRS
ncbi:CK1/TTBK protein kinase [Phytophthora cinnamomi]|uniref:CK1/TTBK protein kinase n=1 Tax=Phytophthora cinnamomi TaxID=4785 RepID=UPI00355A6DB3|nr:CK1/TTBK protein kinase [Phytophthora cinnamomi]